MLVYSPVKLRVVREPDPTRDIEGGIATGFFWQYESDLYLITNWHNVTGWDPISNKSLSESALVPTHIIMPLLYKADADGRPMALRKNHRITLYDEDKRPRWIEHPTFGNRVDVVALRIAPMDDSIFSKPINLLDDFVDFEPQIGDDVFVLGYPGGVDGGNEVAIWKRGSIATLPSFDVDALPKLLIDTATRKGMSGAPVIARQAGMVVPKGVQQIVGTLTGHEIFGRAETFLGIYSGRIGDDPLGLQLGIVWKARVLDEIVKAGAVGKSPYS
jgi:hypothetical protein